MKDTWFRLLLSLAVIFALLGITCGLSLAQPDEIVDVQAYRNSRQAGLIARNRIQPNRYLDSTYTTQSYTNNNVAAKVSAAADAIRAARKADGSWAIDIYGDGNSLANLYGITGMGLLMASEMTADEIPQSEYLNAAMDAGDYLVNQDPNSLLSTDIVFLFGLHKIVTDSNYNQAGLAGLQSFCYDPNFNDPHEVYAFYDSDPNLVSVKHWNLASWVEAANLYAGQDPNLGTWADGIMDLICDDQEAKGGFFYKEFEEEAVTHYCVRTCGQAKVVEVLKRFYADDPDHVNNLKDGLSYLRGLQSDAEGGTSRGGRFSWGGETVNGQLIPWGYETLQDQCYGIQAMAYNFQTTEDNYNKNKGPYWGAGYLIQSMCNDGNIFEDTHGLTRVRVDRNSEAIQALYYSCIEGDVDKSGKVTSFDALRTKKAIDLSGPALVAAQRGADDILKVAVGNNESQIGSFLDMVIQ
ncbi:MAG: hypothetical protein ACMUIA_10055 [bacterium]